ncbi:MAG: hypothetical protein HC824_11075 [Synechococcales cyanobacterium RM1_1_8]|nr:hypothetical protein [Synechococcales cyanobacterium RM1_1_8]
MINARISWFTTSQGLLFATLGVTGDIKNNEGILIILSFLGISTSISTFESLRLANFTRKELREWLKGWRRNHVIKAKDTGEKIEFKYFFPELADFSSNKNEEPTTQLIKKVLRNLEWAIRPWRSFPILFGMTWILLLAYIFAYK